jgi:hypothetical protein
MKNVSKILRPDNRRNLIRPNKPMHRSGRFRRDRQLKREENVQIDFARSVGRLRQFWEGR